MFMWTAFILCSGAIFYSGSRLSHYGDIIAEKTGMGRTWIGVALIASVTSLPELITGISSVTISGAPNIAAGDVLGSCVFNILILALLDAATPSSLPISSQAHQGNIISAAFGIVLLSITALGLYMSSHGTFAIASSIGFYTLLIIPVYFLAMRLVFYYERRSYNAMLKDRGREKKYAHISTATAAYNYAMHAGVVVIAAAFLPYIGVTLAKTTGLGQTFIANILIAFTTSLPEIVVSAAAIRIGAVDLAIGNLFGSNLFNIFILALDDIFYYKGPLLAAVETNHIVSAISAIVMTSIAAIGLTYRASKKQLPVAWDAMAIMVVYILNLLVLFFLRMGPVAGH